MDINRMTQKSQEALQSAQGLALRHGHQEVDSDHLLLALLEQPEGLVPRLLARMDVPVDTLRTEIERELARRPSVSGPGAEAGKIYRRSGCSRCSCAPRTRPNGCATSTSRSSTCCWR
jgi:ATP-dependent Clp protease ATP-binding subunit ClpB